MDKRGHNAPFFVENEFCNACIMSRLDNIYLIGLMGVGKTTIGRKLAGALALPFYDSDKVIEDRTGVDIPTIFAYEGEEGFRSRESKIIEQLTREKGIVLATGGGVVLREQNRNLLTENGFVVYLSCSIENILARTRKDTQRPLLNTQNPRERIVELLGQREALYKSCADFQIDTGKRHTRDVVKSIIRAYKLARKSEQA